MAASSGFDLAPGLNPPSAGGFTPTGLPVEGEESTALGEFRGMAILAMSLHGQDARVTARGGL